MIWSAKFEEAKMECAEFNKLVDNKTLHPSQVRNAYKGLMITLMNFKSTSPEVIIAESEAMQVTYLSRMMGRVMVDYECDLVRASGEKYVMPIDDHQLYMERHQ